MKRRWPQLIALACGLVLCGLCIFYQRPAQGCGAREWFRIVSNAALVPGVLLVGISALSWIAGEGTFDAIRYCMQSLFAHLRRQDKRYASYYDYTQREKKKGSQPMLLPGLCFLAAAVIFTLLYSL